MKKLAFFLALIVAIFTQAQTKTELDGTWILKSYIDHEDNGKSKTYGDDILFQKHIAGCHFAWIKYDTKKKELIGMGGGTFRIDTEGNYIENLEFFYPFGSSELGQSIKFKKSIKGNKWYHSGYVQKMALNYEGELEVVDSVKIEEVWMQAKTKSNGGDLVGTWILRKARNGADQDYSEMTNLIGYFKIITPTHFMWVNYDAEGDQIYASAVGTYSLNGDTYTENIQASYPFPMNQSFSFEYTREGNVWTHVGLVKSPDGEWYIDEIWTPHICRPTEIGMMHD